MEVMVGSINQICYLGNPGPLLAVTLLGQVWSEREEKLREGVQKAKASRLQLGCIWQGQWSLKQARYLADWEWAGKHSGTRAALIWLEIKAVKQD